jgi:hypothetical protein
MPRVDARSLGSKSLSVTAQPGNLDLLRPRIPAGIVGNLAGSVNPYAPARRNASAMLTIGTSR